MKARIALLAIPVVAAAACNAVLGNDPGQLFETPDASEDASRGPEAAPPATDAAAPPPALDAAEEIAPPTEPIDSGPTGCPDGKKRCDGLCVAVNDPAFGCASASCQPCTLARAAASCAGLRCAIASCDPGFADCDQNPANGCETDLSDPAHCGACNAKCGAGAPYCAPQGTAFGCTTGCTGQAPTLCGTQCVDTQTSVTHCGGCNTVCPDPMNGRATCTSAKCGFTCNGGFHACGGGCASNSNPQTCGSSCNPCPTPANGSATCNGTTCGISCNAGFANCDGNAGNGCEVNTTTDAANCGGCGKACPAGWTCEASACTPPPPPPDSGPPPTDGGAG